ncbi:rust resistance kinase Lr10-like isoform X2 [Impatiens glandulifera]|uniref:rust resistance kinase Lr10-like isoform X2 n=1 Tax=Impatiens glandulifera TaxID=253017 RepID=UPI001FB0ACBE|nr:rust resistance kinase Lr10-like isoform X2 [Impatiens glandulifera]
MQGNQIMMRDILRIIRHHDFSSSSLTIVSFMLLWILITFSPLVTVEAITPSQSPAPAPAWFTITDDPELSFPPYIQQQSPFSDRKSNKPSVRIIVILVILLSVLASFAILAFIQFIKNQLAKQAETRFRLDAFLEDIASEKPVKFSSTQLRVCTNNYSTILGSGGFGKVYLGQLPNGVRCAVKVLQRNLDRKTEEQFKAEVITIGRTYHVNLVRLYGFCYERNESALVYEFMKNGSLDKYLFQDNNNVQENGPGLSWERLYEIALGTAKGMAYLHEECHQRIIHYDIKPANILLDHNFSPKVADFGLAKLCNRDQTHVTMTGYRGTPGYSAPEFLLHNFPVSYKCDVYSFGMLLFEILGRRKNLKMSDTSSMDWFPICVWEKYEKGELEELTSSCGIEVAEREQAQRLATVALWCVQDSPFERPRMSVVVKMLEGGVEISPPPKPFSFMFSARSNATNSSMNTGSESMTSGEQDSYWYRDSKSIKSECDIQIDKN